MEYVLCTLLGPEGPGRSTLRGWVGLGLLDPGLITRLTACGWLCGGGGYRPYFENYTVDASIYTLVSNRSGPLVLSDVVRVVLCVSMTSPTDLSVGGKHWSFCNFVCQVFKSKR